MALVRFQCPSCAVVVKIDSEIAARHPAVRCAQCQGLVPTATSRVSEAAVMSVEKPRRKRAPAEVKVPVGMIVGILVGILALAGLGIGIYFLVDHFSKPGPEKTVKQSIALMEKAVIAVEGIQTPQDVAPAMDTLMSVTKELLALKESAMQAGVKAEGETGQRLIQENMPKMLELQRRLNSAMLKVTQKPEMAQAFQAYVRKQGGDWMANLRGNMTLTGGLPPGMPQPNNMKPEQPDPAAQSASAKEEKQSQLDALLMIKSSKLIIVVNMLELVRNAVSAEHALISLEAILPDLQETDRQIKQMLQEKIEPESKAATDALAAIQKQIREIKVQLGRMESMPDVAEARGRIVKRLSNAGLIPMETASANQSGDGNPFEVTGKGAGADASGNNPFETVKPGSSAGMKPSSGTSAGNASLNSTLSKLTGTEFFKKQEGLRELNAIKVDEASKKQVLEALIALFDDHDIHQKNDVFKLYKKWATKQEDKELLGQHAETLLKDPWIKKDAMRYFGENKVVAASKDVARLLKDHFEQKEAAESLIAMGSDAEKSVTPYVTDLEAQVRHLAIEVLARIGTRESIPELQKVQNDRFVGTAAKQAIRLILARKKD